MDDRIDIEGDLHRPGIPSPPLTKRGDMNERWAPWAHQNDDRGPEIADTLRRFYVSYRRRVEAVRAEVAMDSREAATVLVLWCAPGGESHSALGDAIGITANAVTQLVDRMEARKIVERCADPRDRRRVLVCMTAEFRAYCRTFTNRLAAPIETYFNTIDDRDKLVIADFLETVTAMQIDLADVTRRHEHVRAVSVADPWLANEER